MRNELIKYMDEHRIKASLLREFVSKELWSAALISCNESIINQQKELDHLKTLKEIIEKEIG